MPDKKIILAPYLPHISNDLEDFKITNIEPNEWLDVIDCLVLKQSFKGVQKLRLENSKFVDTSISELDLEKCEVSNVLFEKVDATAFRTYRASFSKVKFVDARATGADFAEGYFEDCWFENVKFDEASFRMAHL